MGGHCGNDGTLAGPATNARIRSARHERSMSLPEPMVAARGPMPGMIWIPGGTFRMGSDAHYPEEAPAHPVTVHGFWMDETTVTNRRFAEFVAATGYVTTAEEAPNPRDYPGALPHLLHAGSLVFTPPAGPVDLDDASQW